MDATSNAAVFHHAAAYIEFARADALRETAVAPGTIQPKAGEPVPGTPSEATGEALAFVCEASVYAANEYLAEPMVAERQRLALAMDLARSICIAFRILYADTRMSGSEMQEHFA